MNPQPAHTYPALHPEARIDQVLEALRTTEPPTGLEQRIAARLTQAAEARSHEASAPSSYATVILTAVKDPWSSLAPAKLYTAAALTIIIALTTFTIRHHRTSPNTAQTASDTYAQSRVPHLSDSSTVAKVGIAPSATALPSLEAAAPQPHPTAPTTNAAAEAIPHPLSPSAHARDLDQIALAETLAPSHPAPPMPVTAQEKLIRSATRPGQPIQLAELDLARAPVLRAAAQARETATIDRYVKALLAPFAVADALQPTTQSQPQEAPTPAPAEPTSNPSN